MPNEERRPVEDTEISGKGYGSNTYESIRFVLGATESED